MCADKATRLKEAISKILGNALSGIEPKYWYRGKYIRWGLVEREIREAIDNIIVGEGG